MTKSEQLAVRMTEEKRDALRRAAEASSRSMSSYIDYALTKCLREDGFLPAPATASKKGK